MCFHGRRKNLLAADSVAVTVADSVEDDVDVEDMGCRENRNRIRCVQLRRSLPEPDTKVPNRYSLWWQQNPQFVGCRYFGALWRFGTDQNKVLYKNQSS